MKTGAKQTSVLTTVLIALVAGGLWVVEQMTDDGQAPVPASSTPGETRTESADVGDMSPRHDDGGIANLLANKTSDVVVTCVGRVARLLADDNEGSRHQRFLVDLPGDVTVLVAHNIDLADRVPLRVGDTVIIKGEYEYTLKGGTLHWTHHDPKGWHEDGYVEHRGKRYG